MSSTPKSSWIKKALGVAPMAMMACSIATPALSAPLPDPLLDSKLEQVSAANPKPTAEIVLAGGCFWGVQAVFQHTKGVMTAVAGYAGGDAGHARYDLVSRGNTGHAESVQVIYDPSRLTVGQILKVFFSVAHDPTELNRQGPDTGTQYRSAIFTTTQEQQKIAEAYIEQLNSAGAFKDKIVTTVETLPTFYAAESYHQNYARLHPENPYIAINDLPKVAALQKQFPDLYVNP